MKTCTKCNTEKYLVSFGPQVGGKYGRRSICKACTRAADNERNARNREKVNSRARELYQDPERRAKILSQKRVARERSISQYTEREKRYRTANPERFREATQRWRKRNPERARAVTAASNAKQRSWRAGPSDITVEWLELLEKRALEKGTCPLCEETYVMDQGRFHPKYLNRDHIIPLNVGGRHTKDNLRAVCRECNLRRPKDGSDIET